MRCSNRVSYKSISFNLTIKSDIVSFNDNSGTGGEIGYSHAVLFGYCTTSNQARLMVVLPILSATPAYKFCNGCTVCVSSTLLLCFISFHFILSVCSVILTNHYKVEDNGFEPLSPPCKGGAKTSSANPPISSELMDFHHRNLFSQSA